MNNNLSSVQPYLFFDGRCEEALEFYKRALAAEVTAMLRFKDAPPSPESQAGCGSGQASGDKVMHASFTVHGTTILASDGQCLGKPSFQGFSLSLTTPNLAEAERLFAALSEGGQVQMPFGKTFFSPGFGMVADRFGVPWMIYVAPQA